MAKQESHETDRRVNPPTRIGRPPRPAEDRFWEKVNKTRGCWLWTACCQGDTKSKAGGYGSFRVQGKNVTAHRYSWILHNGPVPDGLHVLHDCDVRTCVNPRHLYLGTHQDNMRDRTERQRLTPIVGEGHANSKLTDDDVRWIRSTDGMLQREMAEILGISQTNVGFIKRGVTWRHVK